MLEKIYFDSLDEEEEAIKRECLEITWETKVIESWVLPVKITPILFGLWLKVTIAEIGWKEII